MLKAASTYVYVRERLHPGLLEGLARAGAQAIELFAARGHFDYSNRNHVREIGNWFKENTTQFHSMHSPMFYDMEWGGVMTAVNIADPERKGRIEAMDEIKRALEVAETAPFRYLVQHVGNSYEEFDPRKFDAALTSVEHLRAFAKPLGVTILLENIPNQLSTPDRLNELRNTVHREDLGFCFDSGHALLGEGVEHTFEQMKHSIKSTHLHDNIQDKDSHLWPGNGKIDWPGLTALLKNAPHTPPALLEIDGEKQKNVLAEITRTFEKIDQWLEQASA